MADKEIKVIYSVEDQTQQGTRSIASRLADLQKQISTLGTQQSAAFAKSASSIQSSAKKIESSTAATAVSANKSFANMSKAGDQLLKKFFGIEAVIHLVKRGIQQLVKGFEDYARITGDDTLKKIKDQFGQLRLEIAESLMPSLRDLSDWFKNNESTISKNVLTTINVVKGALMVFAGNVIAFANEIKIVYDTFYLAYLKIVEGFFFTTSKLYGFLGKIIPSFKEVSDGMKYETNLAKFMSANMADEMSADFERIKSGLLLMGNGYMEFSKDVEQGNKSKIKYRSAEDIAKEADAFKKYASVMREANEFVYNSKAPTEYDKALRGLKKTYNDLIIKISSDAPKMRDSLLSQVTTAFEASKKMLDVTLGATSKILATDEYYNDLMRQEEVARHGESIASINAYYDERIRIARARGEDITKIQREMESAQSSYNIGLRGNLGEAQSYRSTGNNKASRSFNSDQATEALRKQTEQQEQIFQEMLKSEQFGVEELATYRIYMTQYVADQTLAIEQQAVADKVAIWQSAADYSDQIAKGIISIGSNVAQYNINNIENEADAKYKALDEQYKIESRYVKNKTKLDAKYAEAKEKVAQEMADSEKKYKEQQKKWSIASALITGAEMSLNSWNSAMKLGYPQSIIVGAIMQALIVAMTAAEIATISSQKFARGGIVQGAPTGDTVPIQANGGEMMLTTGQQANLWGILSGRTDQGANVPALTIGGDTIIVNGNLDQKAANSINAAKEQRLQQLKQDVKELSYRRQLSFA